MEIKCKGNVIIDNAKLVVNEFKQSMGLRFFRPLKDNEALVFVLSKPRKAMVDMLFVFYKIDILWLDSDKRIIHMQKNALPFCFYVPKNKSKYIIEMKKGSINRFKFEHCKKLEF